MSMAGYPPRAGRAPEILCGLLTLVIGLAELSWAIYNMVDNGFGNYFHAMFYFPVSGENTESLYRAEPSDLILAVAALLAGGYLCAGRKAARGAALLFFGTEAMFVLPRVTAFLGDSETRNALTHTSKNDLATATNFAIVVFGIIVVLTLTISGAQARSRERFGGMMPAPGGYPVPGQQQPLVGPQQQAPWGAPPPQPGNPYGTVPGQQQPPVGPPQQPQPPVGPPPQQPGQPPKG